MRKYFKIKTISIIFILFIFLFQNSKVSAGDVELIKFTAPENNIYTPGTTDTLNFNMIFKVPTVTGNPQPPNDIDAIYFEGHTDNSATYRSLIFNGKKTDYSGQTKSITWKDASVYAFDSLIYHFKVYDYYTGKIYANGQILFKDNKNYAGWYYIYKIQSQTTQTEYYFARSDKFTDQPSCENDWKTFLEKNPKAILYATCKKYDYLPPVPNNEQYVDVDPDKTNSSDDTYTLLAPLPGLETAPENVGDYFNIIFKIAIGLCAVLAVIMIVIGGIQYMGNESIFGKTEAKGRIGAAILGLIIALGAYAILNTINPDLLGNKGVTIKQVSAGIEEEVIDVGSGVNINGTTVKISKGRAVACKSGIVNNTLGSGKICKDLLDKLKILKSKYPDFKITSTIRGGGAASSCHYEGYANSGNCADLQISNNPRKPSYTKSAGSTNPEWGTFCVAVAQVTGLNYLNEASSVANCQNIQKYKAYPQTSGPHLHVNLISN